MIIHDSTIGITSFRKMGLGNIYLLKTINKHTNEKNIIILSKGDIKKINKVVNGE